ncbi:MAG TPA: ABC transporter permease, partial [Balneolaceae bacterium]|nr:ABC transporter permease [Balneolaceae bacterium]
MLKNYLKIALRNLRRNKLYSFINIAGLAVGVTCFLILLLFIWNELSYDSFNKDASNIYRVFVKAYFDGHDASNAKTPGVLGPVLKQKYPDVQAYTRIGYHGMYTFRYNDNVFNESSVYTADSSFFKIFTLKFLEGNPQTALTRPNTMVITESMAKKYFGNREPLGKILKVVKGHIEGTGFKKADEDAGSQGFLITGVIRDFPENSHFRCGFLVSMSTYKVDRYWLGSNFTTYIKLKKGTSSQAFEKKLAKITKDYVVPAARSHGISMSKFRSEGNLYRFELEPMTSIYLRSQRKYGIDPNT